MTFTLLQRRLIAETRARIRNGELSERGLSRKIGLSQPHMHHILAGKRGLRPAVADSILRELRISVLDLIGPDEWPG